MADAKAALGLARRAGRCQVGLQASLKAIRSGKACLVLVDSRTGRSTREAVEALARNCGTPLRTLDPSVSLEEAVGKPNARIAVITDPGFLGMFQDMGLQKHNTETHGGAEKE